MPVYEPEEQEEVLVTDNRFYDPITRKKNIMNSKVTVILHEKQDGEYPLTEIFQPVRRINVYQNGNLSLETVQNGLYLEEYYQADHWKSFKVENIHYFEEEESEGKIQT